MTQTRAVLWSGPLDGHTTAPRRLPFVWVAPVKDGVRIYDQPGNGRLLYRVEDNGWRLVFAGFTHGICEGCDSPQHRQEGDTCQTCGDRLVVPT
jgi:hypothetical protein